MIELPSFGESLTYYINRSYATSLYCTDGITKLLFGRAAAMADIGLVIGMAVSFPDIQTIERRQTFLSNGFIPKDAFP